MNTQEKLAEYLLQSKAIKLEPTKPFTWASGWKSPIYCDNRKTLSFPEIRSYIKEEFVKLIISRYGKPDVIAGVATGAIAHGALVAEAMGLPFVYVRSSAKGHGLENLIEGELKAGQRVIVIEDLISTGGSSLKAVEALKQANAHVAGMAAIFTYGFPQAVKNFKEASCELFTLSDYETLIRIAVDSGQVNESQISVLKEWRENPGNWMQ
jgi:orotate phosphoribosyltransferase